MNYKLTITKIVENPNYEEEKKDSRGYGYQNGNPISKFREETALTVELTDKEFTAIKKAVIETI